MIRITISKIRKVCTIAFIPRVLRGNLHICAAFGKFEKSYAFGFDTVTSAVKCIQKSTKATGDDDLPQSPEKHLKDGISVIKSSKPLDLKNNNDIDIRHSEHNVMGSDIHSNISTQYDKCSKIINEIFGEPTPQEDLLVLSHVNISKDTNYGKIITDKRTQLGIFGKYDLKSFKTTPQVKIKQITDDNHSGKTGHNFQSVLSYDAVFVKDKGSNQSKEDKSKPAEVKQEDAQQLNTSLNDVDPDEYISQWKIDTKALELGCNEKFDKQEIDAYWSDIYETAIENKAAYYKPNQAIDTMNVYRSLKRSDTSSGTRRINLTPEELNLIIHGSPFDDDLCDAIVKSTTDKQNEETLAQKLEHIDETPLVVAEQPKVEGFNTTPKILGNLEKPAPLAYNDIDSVAYRCLGFALSEIDKALLKDIEENLSIPITGQKASRGTKTDNSLKSDTLYTSGTSTEVNPLDDFSVEKLNLSNIIPNSLTGLDGMTLNPSTLQTEKQYCHGLNRTKTSKESSVVVQSNLCAKKSENTTPSADYVKPFDLKDNANATAISNDHIRTDTSALNQSDELEITLQTEKQYCHGLNRTKTSKESSVVVQSNLCAKKSENTTPSADYVKPFDLKDNANATAISNDHIRTDTSALNQSDELEIKQASKPTADKHNPNLSEDIGANDHLDPKHILTCNETCPISPRSLVNVNELKSIEGAETVLERSVLAKSLVMEEEKEGVKAQPVTEKAGESLDDSNSLDDSLKLIQVGNSEMTDEEPKIKKDPIMELPKRPTTEILSATSPQLPENDFTPQTPLAVPINNMKQIDTMASSIKPRESISKKATEQSTESSIKNPINPSKFHIGTEPYTAYEHLRHYPSYKTKENSDAHLVESILATSKHLQATSQKLQATSEKLEVTSEQLHTTKEELQAASEKLEVTSEQLQATSEILQVSCEKMYNRDAMHTNTTKIPVKGTEVSSSVGHPLADVPDISVDPVIKSPVKPSTKSPIPVVETTLKAKETTFNQTTNKAGSPKASHLINPVIKSPVKPSTKSPIPVVETTLKAKETTFNQTTNKAGSPKASHLINPVIKSPVKPSTKSPIPVVETTLKAKETTFNQTTNKAGSPKASHLINPVIKSPVKPSTKSPIPVVETTLKAKETTFNQTTNKAGSPKASHLINKETALTPTLPVTGETPLPPKPKEQQLTGLPEIKDNIKLSELMKLVKDRNRLRAEQSLRTYTGRTAKSIPPMQQPRHMTPVFKPAPGYPKLKPRSKPCSPKKKPKKTNCIQCDLETLGLDYNLGPQFSCNETLNNDNIYQQASQGIALTNDALPSENLSEEIILQLQNMGYILESAYKRGKIGLEAAVLAKTRFQFRSKNYTPWTPIPSWPFPRKYKRPKLQCPSEGCTAPLPRSVHDPPWSMKPCTHFPTYPKRTFSLLDYCTIRLGDPKVVDIGEF